MAMPNPPVTASADMVGSRSVSAKTPVPIAGAKSRNGFLRPTASSPRRNWSNNWGCRADREQLSHRLRWRGELGDGVDPECDRRVVREKLCVGARTYSHAPAHPADANRP